MRTARLLLIATLTLAGCGNATGNGDLVDQWSRMAEPTAWSPQAGTCHEDFVSTLRRSAYQPVDCATPHRIETAHVGRFPAGDDGHPPSTGQPAFRVAWADCDTNANAYLGGPWRDRQLRIDVSTPTLEAWRSGARWYQCQLGPMEWTGNPTSVFKESLKGKYSTSPVLEWGCGSQPDNREYQARSCQEPHDTEYAGWFPLNLPFVTARSKYDGNDPLFHRECLKIVADFVGAADVGKLPRRTGTSYWLPDEKDWEAGDQSVRCFLWIEGAEVSRSLRGAGPAGLAPGTRE